LDNLDKKQTVLGFRKYQVYISLMTHYLFLLQRNLGLSESLRMYWGDNRNPLNIYLFLLVNRYLPRKKYPLYILKQLRDYLHLQ